MKRIKKILIWSAVLLLFLAAALLYGRKRRELAANPDLSGPYSVLYVYDGDTILIDLDGVETRLRLIGVDAPESVHPDEEKNTPEGIVASEWLKKRLEGRRVYLAYDVELTDSYGRTLAYVYEGGSMIQEELLRTGMASCYTVQPNSLHASEFFLIQLEARRNGVGIWSNEPVQ